jgi:HK97 gp10 family phage protein
MTVRAVVVNEDDVRRALQRAGIAPRQVLRAAILAAAEVIEEAAESKAPGPNIGKEVVKNSGTKVEVDVGPDKDHWYYRFVETGTSGHEIRPATKQALLIEMTQFAARAEHPGMSARPFLRPALDENINDARDAAGREWKRALEAAG